MVANSFSAARRNMVDSQVRPNGITDGRIIDAMLAVPRENFVADQQAKLAYMDGAIAHAGGRALMPAMVFAKLLQAAEIRPADKLLIIAAGSGYGAAVAARIARHVTALEENHEALLQARVGLDGLSNVEIVESAIAAGHAPGAPYDVIIVEGRAGHVPDTVLRQLADGGRFVSVIGSGIKSALKVATMKDGSVSWRRLDDCSAPDLPQFAVAAPAFVF